MKLKHKISFIASSLSALPLTSLAIPFGTVSGGETLNSISPILTAATLAIASIVAAPAIVQTISSPKTSNRIPWIPPIKQNFSNNMTGNEWSISGKNSDGYWQKRIIKMNGAWYYITENLNNSFEIISRNMIVVSNSMAKILASRDGFMSGDSGLASVLFAPLVQQSNIIHRSSGSSLNIVTRSSEILNVDTYKTSSNSFVDNCNGAGYCTKDGYVCTLPEKKSEPDNSIFTKNSVNPFLQLACYSSAGSTKNNSSNNNSSIISTITNTITTVANTVSAAVSSTVKNIASTVSKTVGSIFSAVTGKK